MTKKAQRLLERIAETDHASLHLTKGNSAAAEELRKDALAVFIPISTGGAYVCLTQSGIDAAGIKE